MANTADYKILAIIPAYNEEGSIKSTIETLRKEAPNTDFIIVNDGSRDKTLSICRENKYPTLDLPVNLGLDGAFQCGMKYALLNNYDYAFQFDGDGQHPAESIADLINCAVSTNSDIVIGVRQSLNKGLKTAGASTIKAVIRLTRGGIITDPTSGFRLFNRKICSFFAANNNGPEPDTLAFLMRCGVKITEIPVEMKERKAGKSYLTMLNSIKYMAKMIVSILVLNWFQKKAMAEDFE